MLVCVETDADEYGLGEDGRIEVPERPGLGVELDRDVAETHLAPGETLFE